MNELMGAHLFRMRRDKAFWACAAAMLVFAVGLMLNGCRQAGVMANLGYQTELEKYYFTLAPVVGLFAGVFSGLFLGTEYADGAVRNQLIVGHSRRQVYFASLLTNILAALLLTAAWLMGGLVGIPVLGLWKMSGVTVTMNILVAIGSAVALAAIFTLLGMLVTKKSTGVVAAMLLFLGLLLTASWVYNALMEPEMTAGFIMTVDGVQTAELTPNPNYVSGVMRKVLEPILDVLPTGQEAMLANGGVARPLLNLMASVAITVFTTLAGMAVFERKDIK